jgi:hypothetical protein
MASLTITVPDAQVPDLIKAIAPRMLDSTDAAAAAIALKVVNGQATTGAEKTTLGQAWIKRDAVQALQDYRAQVAAVASRDDPANSF